MNNEHDIVIEFGTSLDSEGNFKQYEVANGSIFNFDYSETLDSATILIPHVALENRLWNIKPYDFVRVYDKLSGTDPNNPGRYNFDKNYLIDSFNEQEENIEEHIFTYTINLMSETKLLEKIQCPNLAITHNINDNGTTTKKTIYDYLGQYLSLYCPKAKVNNGDGTWSYKPIIRMPLREGMGRLQQDVNNNWVKFYNGNSIDMLRNVNFLNSFQIYSGRRTLFCARTEDIDEYLESDVNNEKFYIYPTNPRVINIPNDLGSNLESFSIQDTDSGIEEIDQIITVFLELTFTNNLNIDVYVSRTYSFGMYDYYNIWWEEDQMYGDNYAVRKELTFKNAFEDGVLDADFVEGDETFVKIPANSSITAKFYMFRQGVNGPDYRAADTGFMLDGFSKTNGNVSFKVNEDLYFEDLYTYPMFFRNRLGVGISVSRGYKIATQRNIIGIPDEDIVFSENVIIPANGVYEVGTMLTNGVAPSAGFYTTNSSIFLNTPIDDIDASVNPDFFDKFNVTAADMAFTAPTLRQLFTMLMQQVGCIPVVENRTLSYLDFRAEPDSFAISGDDYTVNHTVSKISRSLSSDSYVNTLVSMDSQLLDDNNIVINEVLGFRDRSNVLLRQQSNLVLETRYPIYKIEKFLWHGSNGDSCQTYLPQTRQGCFPEKQNIYTPDAGIDPYDGFDSNTNYYGLYWYKPSESELGNSFIISAGSITQSRTPSELPGIPFEFGGVTYDQWTWKFFQVDVKFYKSEQGANRAIKLTQLGSIRLRKKVNNQWTDGFVMSTDENGYLRFDFEFDPNTNLPLDPQANITKEIIEQADLILFTGAEMSPVLVAEDTDMTADTFPTRNNTQEWFFGTNPCFFVKHLNSKPASTSLNLFNSIVVYVNSGVHVDITDLVAESSQRYLKNTNFLKMAKYPDEGGPSSISELGQYLYGTFGYTIGSRQISGFSDVYTVGSGGIGWYTYNYTYIENVFNFIFGHYQDDRYHNQSFFGFNRKDPKFEITDENGDYIDWPFEPQISPELVRLSFTKNFAFFVFDIRYKPINSINISYTKSREDIPYALEQYSSSASGLSDLDRVSQTQQEQVDRVGNETLTITQVTRNFGNIRSFDDGNGGQRPLLFKDDLNRNGDYADTDEDIQYTIYRMSYAIKNYKYDVSYVGSKDAILKNYFTSIRTKYRAYQNVDYNQAVTRKEKDVVFVRIGEDYYDGDDKIKFFTSEGIDNFFYCFNNEYVYDNPQIVSVYERTPNDAFAYKNEVSLTTTKNMLIINYEDFDNVSPGIYLDKNYSGLSDFSDHTDNLGGVPQKWYLYDNLHNPDAQIIFSNKDFMEANQTWELGTLIMDSPKTLGVFAQDITNQEKLEYFASFIPCDNNKLSADYISRKIYKDISEILNYTVEFSYYSTSENIKWNENFIKSNGFVQNIDSLPVNIVPVSDEDWDNCLHDNTYRSSQYFILCLTDHIEIENDGQGLTNLKINWAQIDNDFENDYEDIGTPITMIKCSFAKEITNLEFDYTDFIAFKRPKDSEDHYVSVSRFYLTLNDTKSDYILSERNGILYKSHKVALNTMDRNVLPENAIWYREDDDND